MSVSRPTSRSSRLQAARIVLQSQIRHQGWNSNCESVAGLDEEAIKGKVHEDWKLHTLARTPQTQRQSRVRYGTKGQAAQRDITSLY
jgi:hypothetical protein